MKWYIGCSGFGYGNWKESFYPKDVKSADWLTYYSTRFNSVELNGTFYRFPVFKNLERFYRITPKDFVFSLKAHRIITHTMKMKDAKEKVTEFMNIVENGLQEKLHCVLFQFPGSFKYSQENLENILESLLPHPSNVIEFRDESWWKDDVFKALKKHSLTFCNVSFPALPEQLIFPTRRTYLRFHGVPKLFYSSYSRAQLLKAAEQFPENVKERYVYFNNTAGNAGYRNAALFQKLTKSK